MPPEWRIEIEKAPCPACDGRGEELPVLKEEGRSRSITHGGTCKECHGLGKINRKVGLAELRKMLDEA
jgi:DnaJ-class molecular chaperone